MAMCKSLLLICFMIYLRITLQKILVTGPGLKPEEIIMPARYFFVNFTSAGIRYYPKLGENLAVEITGQSGEGNRCRLWVNKLDRKDGTFIVRYKMYETCYGVSIKIFYKSKEIKSSPFEFKGPIHADECDCPVHDFDHWLAKYGCNEKSFNKKIDSDLKHFHQVNMQHQVKIIKEKFHRPESTSFCHYVIKNNQVYRDCYGKHVGFNMFADNILLFLSRKVYLPDMELVINLGDWPLVRKAIEPLPVFSWCGSDDTIDIVMPTYDITEATLENMGRVTLDQLSVQGSIGKQWTEREPKAFWRGRDSRAERLTLVDIARSRPDLFNASLTNFFFYRDKEAQYGPKQPHVSFFKFFDYKYQINIDGTVAAYRLAYLLAGGGLILKQDSPYYEHFYHSLEPWIHYVPVSRDLSNLVERIEWAKDHDEQAEKIAENARRFANEHLLPQNIICYHAVLFKEWSKRLTNEVKVGEGMTHVPQTVKSQCQCPNKNKRENREEL